MASEHTESNSVPAVRAQIQDARESLKDARVDYHRSRTSGDGSVPWRVREKLALAAALYYDALWEYKKDRQTVEQSWEQSDVDRIPELEHETVTVEQKAPGDTRNKFRAEKPALAAVDPSQLYEWIRQLDTFYHELGLSPVEAKSEREFGQIGDGEMYDE